MGGRGPRIYILWHALCHFVTGEVTRVSNVVEYVNIIFHLSTYRSLEVFHTETVLGSHDVRNLEPLDPFPGASSRSSVYSVAR